MKHMNHKPFSLFASKILLLSTLQINTLGAYATEANLSNDLLETAPIPGQAAKANPLITPTAPALNAKAYILIDVDSGKIIAEKASGEKLPPASLTKMMTLYVISHGLHNGQIHLDDDVRISQAAWRTGGSRMFIKEGQHVPIKDLLKGIIVDSGNDACVAMAEHLGGSEDGFAQIMNQKAQDLGMKDTHFTDSTGLPNQDLYTTAKDLAILGRALITEFPEYYHWYKQKWYTYNGIRQPNRNRLLWRDNLVDGIKTGHTNEAGFCLVSSAKHDSMRLLSVVMNEPNDTLRADDSERLLNYGFRFYETHSLFKSGQAISQISLYKGQTKKISVGLQKNEYITIPTGQYARLRISTNLPPYVQAPINKGAPIGEMVIHFDNRLLATKPLYALEDAPKGGLYVRAKDSVRLLFKRMIG